MRMSNNISPESGNDAIFLSSMYREDKNSIHGCENELYIFYCMIIVIIIIILLKHF